jgi:hypothetical protein
MESLNKIGQWIENNAIPLCVGFVLGVFVVLERMS